MFDQTPDSFILSVVHRIMQRRLQIHCPIVVLGHGRELDFLEVDVIQRPAELVDHLFHFCLAKHRTVLQMPNLGIPSMFQQDVKNIQRTVLHSSGGACSLQRIERLDPRLARLCILLLNN